MRCFEKKSNIETKSDAVAIPRSINIIIGTSIIVVKLTICDANPADDIV